MKVSSSAGAVSTEATDALAIIACSDGLGPAADQVDKSLETNCQA